MDVATFRARGWGRAAIRSGVTRVGVTRVGATRVAVAMGAVVALLSFGAPEVLAQSEPKGEPVRWDQARVTKIAQELAVAVHAAREAVRTSPLDQNVGQRTTFYELQEDIRLAENSAKYLSRELEAGKGAEETRATFDRIGSLRLAAEENGRRTLIEAPVMDALFKAGELHNRLKPYYYGKR